MNNNVETMDDKNILEMLDQVWGVKPDENGIARLTEQPKNGMVKDMSLEQIEDMKKKLASMQGVLLNRDKSQQTSFGMGR